MTTNSETTEHVKWLKTAGTSSDPRIREMHRVHQQARLGREHWHLVWWLGTRTINDPGYRMTGREIHWRIRKSKPNEELSRSLPKDWNTAKDENIEGVRPFVNKIRDLLSAFNHAPYPHGVCIELPVNPASTEGSYTFRFTTIEDAAPPSELKTGLRPSEQIWDRMLSPIKPVRGMLVYPNEQPELGQKIDKTGAYSGTGEVAAALFVGLRTAHLNTEVIPYRSRRFGLPQFEQNNTWFVFLGSPASNSALALVRGVTKWGRLQKFSFENANDKGPWVLKRNDNVAWCRKHEPAGEHNTAYEFALITYLHVEDQAVIALSGMTTAGTYAAAHFFTTNDGIVEMLSHLGIGPNDPIPSFEVVIKLGVFDGLHAKPSIEASFKHEN